MPTLASPNTNFRTPDPANPSSLSPRYEIRKLEPQHAPWVSAIIMHSNMFHSPLWATLYPSDVVTRVHTGHPACSHLTNHQIDSGMSFGVFDTEYVFKRPESEQLGGKLWWDSNDEAERIPETEEGWREKESKRLLEQMDFPLVSVAMSYDAFNPLDQTQMTDIMAVLPHFGLIYHILSVGDTRSPNPSIPSAHGEILNRNATATRPDYEGQGLMAGLARWLMREADIKGYKGIQIEAAADAVISVWSKAEEPYKGTVVSEFDTSTWVDGDGKKGFLPEVKQRICRVFVELRPGKGGEA